MVFLLWYFIINRTKITMHYMIPLEYKLRVKIHLTNVWCCGEFGDKHVVCLVLWRVRRQTRCMFGVVESSETNTLYVWCCGEFGDKNVVCAYNVFVSELSTTPSIQRVCLRTLHNTKHTRCLSPNSPQWDYQNTRLTP
jgi:hypothetical protein